MRVLCACEESQAVTSELRRLGHEAYSCDLLPTGGAHPRTRSGTSGRTPSRSPSWRGTWSSPSRRSTPLACSGARWWPEKRRDGRAQSAIGLFLALATLDHVPRVAIENPVGIMSRLYRKPDQVIQPWQFGYPETKATCLWLRGLPPLAPTHDVFDEMVRLPDAEAHRVHHMAPGPDRQRLRGRTYPGIARAMAEQWTREDGR